jgi:hypothetical protein
MTRVFSGEGENGGPGRPKEETSTFRERDNGMNPMSCSPVEHGPALITKHSKTEVPRYFYPSAIPKVYDLKRRFAAH